MHVHAQRVLVTTTMRLPPPPPNCTRTAREIVPTDDHNDYHHYDGRLATSSLWARPAISLSLEICIRWSKKRMRACAHAHALQVLRAIKKKPKINTIQLVSLMCVCASTAYLCIICAYSCILSRATHSLVRSTSRRVANFRCAARQLIAANIRLK